MAGDAGESIGQPPLRVPDLVRALLDRQPDLATGLGGIEEAQLDGGGVLAEEGEVHALAVGSGAERIRAAGADAGRGARHRLRGPPSGAAGRPGAGG